MDEEIDLKDIFNIFWRKKAVIILFTLLFMWIGILYTFYYKVPLYKSEITLLLAQNYSEETQGGMNEITQTDINLNQKLVSTYSVLAKSESVLRQVLENLKMDIGNEDSLKKNIKVNSVEDTQVIKITYVNENPENSFKILNELSNVFCEKVKEIYKINNVYIVDKAKLPETPYNINHIKDIALFAMAGMGLSCMVVFIISLFDTTVKSQEDVEKSTGLIVLAQVPELKVGGKK